ncbi:SAM-dependent methyltransferase [Nonlabens spongiae]|uniref:SAM-dependent methyltransferase n=1 Tax=Nonlabens spongiae TaxID=331648 RepID=A0A1W6MG36_9FLAO|nr:methyltransferase domain-containing protein [Nonlabens spongiae]ARN76571.1 SAM-dependent methyltransferase [Nonlabens spongiae]
MILDKHYWTQRYQQDDTPWQLSHASAPLKHVISQIEDKNCSILIPGAGNSRDASYLLQQGFTNVHILDFAEPALESLQQQIESDEITLHLEDFFDHEGSYDFILEQTFFCALESRFRESYPKKCHDLLKSDGAIKGVLFQFESDRTEPPYGGNAEEYRRLFSPFFEIKSMENCEISEPDRRGRELLIHFLKK